MDDPIFDPWCLDPDDWPTPSQRASRWRSATGNQGVPVTRPVPSPIVRETDDPETVFREDAFRPLPQAAEPRTSSRDDLGDEPTFIDIALDAFVAEELATDEPPTPTSDTPAAPSSEPTRPSPATASHTDSPDGAEVPSPRPTAPSPHELGTPPRAMPRRPTPARPDARAPERSKPSGAVHPRGLPEADLPPTRIPRNAARGQVHVDTTSALHAVVLPRIADAARRLTRDRHRVTLDERLTDRPPSIRFKIEPWVGPFDNAEASRGVVLEVAGDGGREERMVARLWLDPMARRPTEERTVKIAGLDARWIDALLLELVEKALAQR